MHAYVLRYMYTSPCIFVYVQLHQIVYKIFKSLYTWFMSSLRSAPLRKKKLYVYEIGVFVYVKKCVSTKWCLYELKSLTDETRVQHCGYTATSSPGKPMVLSKTLVFTGIVRPPFSPPSLSPPTSCTGISIAALSLSHSQVSGPTTT